MTAELAAIAALALAVIILIFLLFGRKSPDYSQSFLLIQQRIGQIEDQVKRSLEEGNKGVNERFDSSLKVIGTLKRPSAAWNKPTSGCWR